ncbi:MAG: F0F1 ATP synthase subunit epsilon [Acidobacteria bacterium]|nr:F0F1 ATP synthase subunit epsilon [Acidobacteriota bacterium]
MADTIHLEIVTPERHLVDARVDSVQVPGLDGELGILPGHSPLISQLKAAGLLSYVEGGTTHQVVIAEGFVEVLPDKVRVLAEVAEKPDEIDIDRAIKARERAEKLVTQSMTDSGVDSGAATDALARAAARLEVARKK